MRVPNGSQWNRWRWLLQLQAPGVLVVHPWGLLAALLRSPSHLLDGITASHHRYLDRAAVAVTQRPVLIPNGFFSDGCGSLNTPKRERPLAVLLPGTGEHGFLHRRTSIAITLVKQGVATLILEGPFYGKRKPPQQKGSKLRRVIGLPILGQATIEEAKPLLEHF
ncbi:uncharacterized protein IUM83_01077 [Phytophthora cinnamomi]|uniref:uncharacterized protein n=1 Tax=Phytophthora cinnamomi TaxID=4785 RepID=UPI003559C597|nr:hypothetical protein IUM83_01077 [Phytophthora cinnamomi]